MKTRPTKNLDRKPRILNKEFDERISVAKSISEQLNRMLVAKLGQGELLRHNLEKGLGNEQSLRDPVNSLTTLTKRQNRDKN